MLSAKGYFHPWNSRRRGPPLPLQQRGPMRRIIHWTGRAMCRAGRMLLCHPLFRGIFMSRYVALPFVYFGAPSYGGFVGLYRRSFASCRFEEVGSYRALSRAHDTFRNEQVSGDTSFRQVTMVTYREYIDADWKKRAHLGTNTTVWKMIPVACHRSYTNFRSSSSLKQDQQTTTAIRFVCFILPQTSQGLIQYSTRPSTIEARTICARKSGGYP